MILELADIRIQPGRGAEFDEAIRRGVETVIAERRRLPRATASSRASNRPIATC